MNPSILVPMNPNPGLPASPRPRAARSANVILAEEFDVVAATALVRDIRNSAGLSSSLRVAGSSREAAVQHPAERINARRVPGLNFDSGAAVGPSFSWYDGDPWLRGGGMGDRGRAAARGGAGARQTQLRWEFPPGDSSRDLVRRAARAGSVSYSQFQPCRTFERLLANVP